MSRKAEFVLTQESFDRFLASLDPGREGAGIKYEAIRRKLLTFFRSRDCAEAERLADETIDRVIRKQDEIEIREPIPYVLAVARRVASEFHKHEAQHPILTPPPTAAAYDEQVMEYLEACLERLALKDRGIILEYYQHDKRAKIEDKRRIAAALGIGHAALRVRAFRIRRQLEECVSSRAAKASGGL